MSEPILPGIVRSNAASWSFEGQPKEQLAAELEADGSIKDPAVLERLKRCVRIRLVKRAKPDGTADARGCGYDWYFEGVKDGNV